MTQETEHRWKLWNEQILEDNDLTKELYAIRNDESLISDCFYKELEFGTGGLRGIIGVGTNRMNIYTVAKATQGYTDYLKSHNQAPSVAIAYDSRIKSDLFSRTAAEVFAANGIQVYMYGELMPTPALSFAIRHLKCSGGIVVTASHNPAQYNGYKVYGADGCQITMDAAAKILGHIRKVDVFCDITKMNFEDAVRTGRIRMIDDSTVSAYIHAVSSENLCAECVDKNISIIYTPLNGTGRYCVTRVLEENGFRNVTLVKEQEWPDGNFPTCPCPNPEIESAMELGIEYAKKAGSELLLATDPDCDRVGIAIRKKNDYILLSANETGMLLLDYICNRRIALGTMPDRPLAFKSIVTIDMAKRIAAGYGVEMREVLTGFKFIGEQIGYLEEKGETERFIFGFEESYGYLSGTYVRDKDGVNASLLICEMFAYYKARGVSLPEVLDSLYEKYGYCLNTLHSYSFEGTKGFQRMKEIMDGFRGVDMPNMFMGRKVISVSDYKESVIRHLNGGEEKICLPKSNVLKFVLEGDSSVVIRPSGTEPKMKVYLSVSGNDKEEVELMEKIAAREVEMRLG